MYEHSDNSGNFSYTWVTNNITVDHSFNTTGSHNGHGRGGWCGVVALVVLVGVPIALMWFVLSVIAEVFR